MNKLILVGRVGKDAETVVLPSGAVKISFSVATDDGYTGRDGQWVDQTDWHNIIFVRPAGNGGANYLESIARKGNIVSLTGKSKTRSWEKDGVKHYSTEMHLEEFSLVSKAKAANAGVPTPAPAPQEPANTPEYPSFGNWG